MLEHQTDRWAQNLKQLLLRIGIAHTEREVDNAGFVVAAVAVAATDDCFEFVELHPMRVNLKHLRSSLRTLPRTMIHQIVLVLIEKMGCFLDYYYCFQ